MTKPKAYQKILQHPDKDEIINKLVIGQSTTDINDWLKSKYTNVSELKFVISEASLKSFQNTYLDFYTDIQSDLSKTKSALAVDNSTDQLELAVRGNPAYKDAMVKMATTELDIRKIVANLCINVETRLAQVFDEIQENPRDINTKVDRLLIDYAEVLGNILEKYYKFTEAPADQIVQHNVTLQVVDQHISVFHDVIKEVLSQMDLSTSQYFLEVFNEKFSKLKAPQTETQPTQEVKLAEVTLLNETINKRINES
jgi:hypothetical protein